MKWAAAAVAVAFLVAALVWTVLSNYVSPGWGAAASLWAAGGTMALAGLLGVPRRHALAKPTQAPQGAPAQRATA